MTIEARDGGTSTKFSLRSGGDIDVAEIARAFQGGGHKNAAGMNIQTTPPLAIRQALAAVIKALEA